MSVCATIPANVVQLTGPQLLGFAGNWALFGCVSVQVYMYHVSFPNDRWPLKLLVYGLFIWDVLQTMLYTSSVFSWLGSNWGNATAMDKPGITWFTIPFMSGVASAAVQCFYAWRIFILSNSKLLTLFIVMIALMEGSAAMADGVMTKIGVNSFAELQNKNFAVTTVWLLGSAVCDIIICVSMTYYLSRARKITGYKSTENMLTRLINLAVGTGLLTASIAIIAAILFIVYRNNNYHIVPDDVIGKLYTNALMVQFNSRRREIDDTDKYTWDGEHRSKSLLSLNLNPKDIAVTVNIHENIEKGGSDSTSY
ncbi:hypothetical protein BDP27DRAFT_1271147 [Rhodocollybia butyracea]|uniref:DUF6534 domain-containing protein n=1 Tax=Rhodocollybia butyracea TaxID=206335 RepID=A0A9P5PJD2_9AGAR|nr:hypothetical protein BDP27DRAFT_1271147 [Rhodocollybia butyracea]